MTSRLMFKPMSESDLVNKWCSVLWFVSLHASNLKPVTRQHPFYLWSWCQGGHKMSTALFQSFGWPLRRARNGSVHLSPTPAVCVIQAAPTPYISFIYLNFFLQWSWKRTHTSTHAVAVFRFQRVRHLACYGTLKHWFKYMRKSCWELREDTFSPVDKPKEGLVPVSVHDQGFGFRCWRSS